MGGRAPPQCHTALPPPAFPSVFSSKGNMRSCSTCRSQGWVGRCSIISLVASISLPFRCPETLPHPRHPTSSTSAQYPANGHLILILTDAHWRHVQGRLGTVNQVRLELGGLTVLGSAWGPFSHGAGGRDKAWPRRTCSSQEQMRKQFSR